MITMLKLMRSKNGNYGFKMDKGFMGVFQNSISRVINGYKILDIDKVIMQSIHDYCWAWNKLDSIINDGVMNKNMNGNGEFDDIIEKQLEFWASTHKIDLSKVTSLKCSRCGTVVDRIEVLRYMELQDEPRCQQCPGQDMFTSKHLKLIPEVC